MSAPPYPTDRVSLRELSFVPEGDEVMIGCAGSDQYAVFPADGAGLVRRLADGMPAAAAARWYEETYGESVDLADFLDTLRELGFVGEADPGVPPAPLRWRRLGRAVFSPPAWLAYAALVGCAVVLVLRDGSLVPTPRSMLFAGYLTVVTAVLFTGQVLLLLVHEAFHMLAGRRLDLPSRLRVGRRLYFVVAETTLTGLLGVPRRKRYLPLLAGILADVLAIALLVDLAALFSPSGGARPMAARICLGLAFVTVLRLVWQLYFYLETDLYYVLATALGAVDLQANARAELRRWAAAARRRPVAPAPPGRERRLARGYAPLLAFGYAFSLVALAVSLPPVLARVGSGIRRGPAGGSLDHFLDSVVFLVLMALQVAILVVLAVRERRARRPVEGTPS